MLLPRYCLTLCNHMGQLTHRISAISTSTTAITQNDLPTEDGFDDEQTIASLADMDDLELECVKQLCTVDRQSAPSRSGRCKYLLSRETKTLHTSRTQAAVDPAYIKRNQQDKRAPKHERRLRQSNLRIPTYTLSENHTPDYDFTKKHTRGTTPSFTNPRIPEMKSINLVVLYIGYQGVRRLSHLLYDRRKHRG